MFISERVFKQYLYKMPSLWFIYRTKSSCDTCLVLASLANTSGAFALGSDSAELAMLLDALAYPVVLGVVADGIVVGVHKDDLKYNLVSYRLYNQPLQT